MNDSNQTFTEAQREGLYRAIFERRDVRFQFLPDAIPDAVLARLLEAAHHAPSVDFMQPWRSRLPLEELVHGNRWSQPLEKPELVQRLQGRGKHSG